MIPVGAQQSLNFDALAEAIVLQWPDFRGAPLIAGGHAGAGSKEMVERGIVRPSLRFALLLLGRYLFWDFFLFLGGDFFSFFGPLVL